MKLKNLLFVFCLALLAGCQKDPDTESAPARDTDRVEGVIRMKLDRETAEALNVTRTRSGRVLTGNISFDELCKRTVRGDRYGAVVRRQRLRRANA